MLSYFQGHSGEYMWKKEMRRLERTRRRPWEYHFDATVSWDWIVLLGACLGVPGLLVFLSLF